MQEMSVIQQGGGLAIFDPQKTKANNAKTDAIMDFAAKVRDWPLLQQAIALKLNEQEDFVNWWEGAVTVRESPGRNGVKSNTDRRSISKSDAESETGISQQQVSRWRKRLKDRDKSERELFETFYKRGMAKTAEKGAVHVANNSGDNEWYTPPEFIEAARATMESIDFDPASSDIANRTVKAARYLTIRDDGLSQEWAGNVWLNPPYSSDLVSRFCSKLAEEYRQGRVYQACALVNNATETQWFQSLLRITTAVCFPSGRIRFLNRNGEPANSPLQGQAILYFGGERERFAKAFSSIGSILVAA